MEEQFSERRAEYPWQIEVHARAPGADETETERRADFAYFSFDFWKALMDEDLRGPPVLGRRGGFFRSSDGTFTLSRGRGDCPA